VAFASVIDGKAFGAEGGEEGLNFGDDCVDGGYVVPLVCKVAGW
jgi:hypothetical protein